MTKRIKQFAQTAVLLITISALAVSLPACKANKCDCPTFGGHKQKH